jgi:hypothetical protein
MHSPPSLCPWAGNVTRLPPACAAAGATVLVSVLIMHSLVNPPVGCLDHLIKHSKCCESVEAMPYTSVAIIGGPRIARGAQHGLLSMALFDCSSTPA